MIRRRKGRRKHTPVSLHLTSSVTSHNNLVLTFALMLVFASHFSLIILSYLAQIVEDIGMLQIVLLLIVHLTHPLDACNHRGWSMRCCHCKSSNSRFEPSCRHCKPLSGLFNLHCSSSFRCFIAIDNG